MYLRHSLFLLGKLNYALVFQGKDGYSMFESCPQMFDTETAHVLSTVVVITSNQ